MENININDFEDITPLINGFDKERIKITKSGLFFPIELCSSNKLKILMNENIILFNFSEEGFSLSPNGKSKSSKKIYISPVSRLKRILFDEHKIELGAYKFEKLEIEDKIYYKIEINNTKEVLSNSSPPVRTQSL